MIKERGDETQVQSGLTQFLHEGEIGGMVADIVEVGVVVHVVEVGVTETDGMLDLADRQGGFAGEGKGASEVVVGDGVVGTETDETTVDGKSVLAASDVGVMVAEKLEDLDAVGGTFEDRGEEIDLEGNLGLVRLTGGSLGSGNAGRVAGVETMLVRHRWTYRAGGNCASLPL